MINSIKKLVLLKYPNGDVTQWFGENPQLYKQFDLAGHNGVDIVRPYGEVMYAIEDGIVVEDNDDPKGHGIHIRIISDAKADNGFYREWTYGHCSRNLVSQGDHVTAGQAIALMGNTGFVVSGANPYWKYNPYAGTHLHLGLRYMKKPKTGGWFYKGSKVRLSVVNYGNGYKGAVDPVPELWQCEDLTEANVWRQSALTVVALLNTVINLIRK